MTADDQQPAPEPIPAAAVSTAPERAGPDPETADRDTDAEDAAGESSDEGRFGTPGPPLDRRNPFFIGFVGGVGVLVAYASFLGVRNAGSILVLIFVAMFLAIGLNPAVTRIHRWGLPRGAAVALVTLIGLTLLAGGVYALVPPLVTQTAELIGNIPDYIQSLQRNETMTPDA